MCPWGGLAFSHARIRAINVSTRGALQRTPTSFENPEPARSLFLPCTPGFSVLPFAPLFYPNYSHARKLGFHVGSFGLFDCSDDQRKSAPCSTGFVA